MKKRHLVVILIYIIFVIVMTLIFSGIYVKNKLVGKAIEPVSGNLLKNPSFEQGMLGQKPTYWTIVSEGDYVEKNYGELVAIDRSYLMKLTDRNGGEAYVKNSEMISLTSGKYEMSYWVISSAANTLSQMYLICNFGDGSYDFVQKNVGTSWEKVSKIIDTTNWRTKNNCYVRLDVDTPYRTLFIDDVKLGKYSPDLIANPSFEEGNFNSHPSNWVVSNGISIKTNEVPSVDGRFILKLTSNGQESSIRNSNTFSVNGKYKMSFSLMTTKGLNAEMFLVCGNNYDVIRSNYNSIAFRWQTFSKIVDTTDWSTKDNCYVKLKLYGTNFAYFDNIKLEPAEEIGNLCDMKWKSCVIEGCYGKEFCENGIWTSCIKDKPDCLNSASPRNQIMNVLVNQESDNYIDFEKYIRPYLDNFGMPYIVTDVSSEEINEKIANFSLIIIGHKNIGGEIDSREENYIKEAVNSGAGIINFDDSKFILFSSYPSTQITASSIRIPSNEHYITSLQTRNTILSTFIPFTLNSIPSSSGTVLAYTNNAPLIIVKNYGKGKFVQFMSYKWMDEKVKGAVFGMDDLIWRSIVWAARKPFIMQGMPPFITMRVDDVVGETNRDNNDYRWDIPLKWAEVAEEYGYKPFLAIDYGHFKDNPSRISYLKQTVTKGATASVHSIYVDAGPGKFFYYDIYGIGRGSPYSDEAMARNYNDANNFFISNNIPKGKYALAHWYAMGANSFRELKGKMNVEFVGISHPTDNAFSIGKEPYRIFNISSIRNAKRPFYYADWMKIYGINDKTYFNVITEIVDDNGYQWFEDGQTTQEIITHGTAQLKRALDSMVLPVLFTHEYLIILKTEGEWRNILSSIKNNLASYNPEFVTMDYAAQYIRAIYTSEISDVNYNNGILKVKFSGSTDMPTRFYLFKENSQEMIEIPAFTGNYAYESRICENEADTDCNGCISNNEFSSYKEKWRILQVTNENFTIAKNAWVIRGCA